MIDSINHILSFCAGGSWHAPLRLVCRHWAQQLDVPLRAYAPFEWAVTEKDCIHRSIRRAQWYDDRAIFRWLKAQGVPWSLQVLNAVATAGRFDSIDWAVFSMGMRGPHHRLRDRVVFTRFVVDGGYPALRLAEQRRPGGASFSSLVWNEGTLLYVIHRHGPGPRTEWLRVWPLALTLCGGWCIAGLHKALGCCGPTAVRDIMQHPDAMAVLTAEEAWSPLLVKCAGCRSLEVLEVIDSFVPATVRVFPWKSLEMAVQQRNKRFIQWFLQHPRRPRNAHCFAARRCTLAAVMEYDLVCGRETIELLETLREVGVQWHEDVLLVAIDRGSYDVILRLLECGVHTEFRLDQGTLFLRAANAGNIPAMRALEMHFGILTSTDPLLMATAAEMGHVEMLNFLHLRGCVSDHRVLQFALLNGHMLTAQWALDHDTPSFNGGETRDALQEWVTSQL